MRQPMTFIDQNENVSLTDILHITFDLPGCMCVCVCQYLVSVPLRMFRLWAFMGMMAQVRSNTSSFYVWICFYHMLNSLYLVLPSMAKTLTIVNCVAGLLWIFFENSSRELNGYEGFCSSLPQSLKIVLVDDLPEGWEETIVNEPVINCHKS